MKSILVPFFLLFFSGNVLSQSVRSQTATPGDGRASHGYSGPSLYVGNKAPLIPDHFLKLPVTAFRPGGWLKRQLELQRDGLTGHLGEISIWLSKKDNAWLNKEGKGKWGWEELPYWLKGYADIGYMLGDRKMIKESLFWIDTVLDNQRTNGDFGPMVTRNGKRDLWTNMPMLWCLQSYYEYSGDRRVLPFMEKYFKWELSLPDSMFLKDFWENSRGGDNLISVYWLYNRIQARWLLELATKIDRNTANWRQKDNLPNWHNVNIAQSFREPAEYYQLSHDPADLQASYADFKFVRQIYGQVPGGLFGSDENARKGYDDPRQAVETCGMVEQMTSDQLLLRSTGDPYWAENCEDIAFNTFPAAFMPDYRSLRYLTAPNMVVSDSKDHSPGIANSGPFLMMNPFSSRCCQHNHAAGWVYYAENCWMATPDMGLAAQFYSEGTIRAKVGGGPTAGRSGDGKVVEIEEKTHYPFEEKILFTVKAARPVGFPLYLRVPAWCKHAVVRINGSEVTGAPDAGYIRLARTWIDGDRVELSLPMELSLRTWEHNKNSVSVNYGPLTFSLKIAERFVKKDSRETAMGDSHWQESADAANWPSFEIYPASDWNYGLVLDAGNAVGSFSVVRKPWPADDNPFVNSAAPIELRARGKKIPAWGIDQYGLCGVLPQSPVAGDHPEEEITLVPMGGARLRISAFPVIGGASGGAAGSGAAAAGDGAGGRTFVNPVLPSGPDPYSFYKDGFYYYTNTMGNRLVLWKTANIADLKTAEMKTIFVPSAGTAWSKDLWAPEVLFVGDKWYAYFAADGGNNQGHRLYVLENASADPMKGEWVFKGKIADPSDKWAIDGDVFSYKDQWYILWSGWEGDINRQQNIYIAKMKNPWTIDGSRVLLSQPQYGWEKQGDLHNPNDVPHIDVNEGPQALEHDGRLFVVYSASACWTDDYALGMVSFHGDDVMNPANWTKSPVPVFKQSPSNGVYATGHNSFFRSPDRKEDWILYHANSKPGQGCGNTRSPRAQPFRWKADGSPDFGLPVGDGVAIPVPGMGGIK